MAILLHEQFRESLLRKLRSLVADIRFESGCFLDRDTVYPLFELDEDIKKRKEVSEKLVETIGENPFFLFVSEHLSQQIRDNYDYEKDTAGFVSDLPVFKQELDLAQQLMKAFESLPWNYTATFVLPESLNQLLPEHTDEMTFSTSSRLVRTTEEMQEAYPLTSGNKRRDQAGMGLLGAFLLGDDNLPTGRLLFQTQLDGFVGVYDNGAALLRAETRLKAFIGFLIAIGTLKVDFFSYFPNPPSTELIVHQGVGPRWEYLRRQKLDQEFSRLITKIHINDFDGKLRDAEGRLEHWTKAGLHRCGRGFSETKAARRLQLAASWLFDSLANNRDLLAFVQAMVCLEILLGEQGDEEVGIGSLLRNRCAFLIGRSHDEREEITARLKAIYQVRSKIVHRGKSQLSRSEMGMLFELRNYCNRVIFKELEIATAR